MKFLIVVYCHVNINGKFILKKSLCYECANLLRLQTKKCPLCRSDCNKFIILPTDEIV
jgi:hypothetical protein